LAQQKGQRQSGCCSQRPPPAEPLKKKLKRPAPGVRKPAARNARRRAPAGDDWLHEIKYDGYRAITSIAGGKVVIRTRNGLDWTDRFRALVPALAELPCDDALLDGEIAVADAEGHTDFGALQDTLSADGSGIGYYIFDLLEVDGEDLRRRPLIERKEKLSELLKGVSAPLLYSDHLDGSGDKVFAQACKINLEGIVSKHSDAPYVSGRSKSWLKSKCGQAQEFVIIGWRPSTKPGRPFSSLLLAVREGGTLRYAGRVGSGYSGQSLAGLSADFAKLARKDAPVDNVPAAIARHARFLKPKLVAEIAFRGWTRDRLVRQGSFKGLRRDKPPDEIVQERVMPTAQAVKSAKAELRTSAKLKSAKPRPALSKPAGDADEIAGVHITHADRVLFAPQGVTKRGLIDYYLAVADRMLPHIAGRPLALVRCPQGSGKECFFQKHASPGWPDLFMKIRIKEKSGSDDYLHIEDERGLVAAAQMGVLELHIWGSRADRVEWPDRMVFDLDPDEGLAFSKVKDAAHELKDRLSELGLQSFPMATGGKGIHVVVPLQRRHSWDDHRAFAEAIARLMAEESPERYVANMSKAKRRGKIFVDYLRNQRGSTAIAPYSTRARSGAFVALPVSWKALSGLKDAHPANVATAARKIAVGGDSWAGYHKVRQTLPQSKLRS
jgi:bifunctional non-homologous end joining protein LigD